MKIVFLALLSVLFFSGCSDDGEADKFAHDNKDALKQIFN